MSQSIVSQSRISMDYDPGRNGDGSRTQAQDEEKHEDKQALPQDVYGDEQNAEIKYKVLSWWYVSFSLRLFLICLAFLILMFFYFILFFPYFILILISLFFFPCLLLSLYNITMLPLSY
jgi:hypothetical protein